MKTKMPHNAVAGCCARTSLEDRPLLSPIQAGGLAAVGLLFATLTVLLALVQRLTALCQSIRLWGQSLNESGYLRAALLLQMTIIITFAAIAINAPPSRIVYTAF